MGETNFPRSFGIMTFVNVDCCRSRLRKCVGASFQLPSISIQICGMERSCRECKIRLAIAIFLFSLPIYSSVDLSQSRDEEKREEYCSISLFAKFPRTKFRSRNLKNIKVRVAHEDFPQIVKVKFTMSIRFFR